MLGRQRQRAALADLPTVVRQLHDVVPADRAADVDAVAETLDGFVAVLARFDFDTAAATADPQAAADLAAQRADCHSRGISTESIDWSDRVAEALARYDQHS